MPYSTLIATAGISALGQRNHIGKKLRADDSPVIFHPGKQNPVPRDEKQDHESTILACLDQLQTTPQPLNTPEDHAHVSAEFSVFHQLRENKKLSAKATVHLIHTPTLAGRLAVEAQKPYWEQLGARIIAHELSVPFDPSQSGGLALASGAFIGQISRLLRQNTPQNAAFAPIGGYKVMVALGHTAASFHGFSSLYLHEDSQVLQKIAPAPVSLPDDPELAALARKIGNGLELSPLLPEEIPLLEKHPGFFTRVDQLVELNELGQFLRLNEIPVLLSPEAEKERQKEPALLKSQLLQIRDLACQNPEHPGINHDLTRTTGRSHNWRLARMGDGNRYAWQLHGQSILIKKIWRDHDTYNKEAPALIQSPLPGKNDTFHALT